jgi:hypothetical protein
VSAINPKRIPLDQRLDWAAHGDFRTRFSRMPPILAKRALNNMHLAGELDGADYAYWLTELDIDPSL